MAQIGKPKLLIDTYGRRIRKLRISLLDACNFRCFYCMPINANFMKSSNWLSPFEIQQICSHLCEYGLEQIRITGGEPTLRKDFRQIVRDLSQLGLKKLGMTTNGFFLSRELEFLLDTSCRYLNISLDSLSKKTFHLITRRDVFEPVYRSILKAKNMGFHVKINTVLMRGVNDHEIFDFIRFSALHKIEVRFLEIMKIGQACKSQEELFISAQEVINKIQHQEWLEKETMETDSTSFNFRTSSGARIGFIASESQAFCSQCSRWRLSAKGFLRACLMSNKGVKIRGVDPNEYDELLASLLWMKPMNRIHHVPEDMNQIGG